MSKLKGIWIADWHFRRKLGKSKDVIPVIMTDVVTPYTDNIDELKDNLFLIRRALRHVNLKEFILDTHGFPKVYDIKFTKKVG